VATRTPITNFDPKTTAWTQRASDEYLRRHGRIRDLVLRMLATTEETTDEGNGWTTRVTRTRSRDEPSREDVAAALGERIPCVLLDYVRRAFVLETRPRKTGRKTHTRSTWDDVMIIAFYEHQLQKANARQRSGLTASPATRAAQRTASKFGISKSTVEHLLTEDRQRRSLIAPSKK
jgi:hypothetical protein